MRPTPTQAVKERFGTSFVQVVYAAATPYGIEITNAKRLGNAGSKDFVAIYAGGLPLRAYLHRRYEASKQPSGLFEDDIKADLLELERHQAEAVLSGHSPDAATRLALVAHDGEVNDLLRLWNNGAPYALIAELNYTTVGVTRARVDHLRALGFYMPSRYEFGSRAA